MGCIQSTCSARAPVGNGNNSAPLETACVRVPTEAVQVRATAGLAGLPERSIRRIQSGANDVSVLQIRNIQRILDDTHQFIAGLTNVILHAHFGEAEELRGIRSEAIALRRRMENRLQTNEGDMADEFLAQLRAIQARCADLPSSSR